MKYFLSLGSNLGQKEKNIQQAQSLLVKNGAKILQCSSLYETEPVEVSDQPWFYNRVIEIETDLAPKDLLRVIKNIEDILGREPSLEKAPRVIDIDIILAEETVIETKELRVPHTQMERRNFVLIPLNEIAPKTVHPIFKKTIEELLLSSKDFPKVRKIIK